MGVNHNKKRFKSPLVQAEKGCSRLGERRKECMFRSLSTYPRLIKGCVGLSECAAKALFPICNASQGI